MDKNDIHIIFPFSNLGKTLNLHKQFIEIEDKIIEIIKDYQKVNFISRLRYMEGKPKEKKKANSAFDVVFSGAENCKLLRVRTFWKKGCIFDKKEVRPLT